MGKKPHFVGPGIKTGINILYDNPKELGSDRIVNAVAAYEKNMAAPASQWILGRPLPMEQFLRRVSSWAVQYAGVKISAEALISNTAKLPRVELTMPKTVINKSTVSCMQSGLLYGYVGQVDYILRKMKAEIGGKATVVATGGLADDDRPADQDN